VVNSREYVGLLIPVVVLALRGTATSAQSISVHDWRSDTIVIVQPEIRLLEHYNLAGRMRLAKSLVVGTESKFNYSSLVFHYPDHYRLSTVFLMPGCNFVVTGRQLQLE
jgi:hypothetical protein